MPGQSCEPDVVNPQVTEVADTVDRLAEATESEGNKVALIMHSTSLACGIPAAQPLPFADIVVLTPMQIAAVAAMNRAMGKPVPEDKVTEVLGAVSDVVGGGLSRVEA